jgi:hypothetical protein
MKLILLKPDSTEWNYMWEWLENHPINKGLEEPKTADNQGICWEYMASYMERDRAVHTFRHLAHPNTGTEIKTSVNASKDFNESHIAVDRKI